MYAKQDIKSTIFTHELFLKQSISQSNTLAE